MESDEYMSKRIFLKGMLVEGYQVKSRLLFFYKLISHRLLNGMDKITDDEEEYLTLKIRITLSKLQYCVEFLLSWLEIMN